MKFHSKLAAALLTMSATGGAWAVADPVYGDPGTMNAVSYTFEAVATGHVYAYFLGESAAYTEVLGMSTAGSTTPIGKVGLSNQTSVRGQKIDLGKVTQGEIVTFFIDVTTTGKVWSSQTDLNSDDANHVYSTTFAKSGHIPMGTFISFEDIAKNAKSDFDYNDTSFLITNVAIAPAVPEPANVALLLAGLGLMGFVARRRRG